MSKWKALAVFFTLLFFSSLGATLFVYFSDAKQMQGNRVVGLSLSILTNLILLFWAVRYWRRAFKADNKRPE